MSLLSFLSTTHIISLGGSFHPYLQKHYDLSEPVVFRLKQLNRRTDLVRVGKCLFTKQGKSLRNLFNGQLLLETDSDMLFTSTNRPQSRIQYDFGKTICTDGKVYLFNNIPTYPRFWQLELPVYIDRIVVESQDVFILSSKGIVYAIRGGTRYRKIEVPYAVKEIFLYGNGTGPIFLTFCGKAYRYRYMWDRNNNGVWVVEPETTTLIKAPEIIDNMFLQQYEGDDLYLVMRSNKVYTTGRDKPLILQDYIPEDERLIQLGRDRVSEVLVLLTDKGNVYIKPCKGNPFELVLPERIVRLRSGYGRGRGCDKVLLLSENGKIYIQEKGVYFTFPELKNEIVTRVEHEGRSTIVFTFSGRVYADYVAERRRKGSKSSKSKAHFVLLDVPSNIVEISDEPGAYWPNLLLEDGTLLFRRKL